jgi:RNA polymerase sigma-70 factor (ECF subfamily)
MTRLAEEQAAAGKRALFDSLRPFLAGEADGLAYADVAVRLGLREEAARMTVTRLRRRYRQLLRREVANTVADPTEIDEELHYLLAAVQ